MTRKRRILLPALETEVFVHDTDGTLRITQEDGEYGIILTRTQADDLSAFIAENLVHLQDFYDREE